MERRLSFSFDHNRLTKRMFSLSDTTRRLTIRPDLSKSLQKSETKNASRTFHGTFFKIEEKMPSTPRPSTETSTLQRPISYRSLTQPKYRKKFTLLSRMKESKEESKLDSHISKWQKINTHLSKMIPPPLIVTSKLTAAKPKIIITQDRVREVVESICRHLEHFWNIYMSAEKMTSYIRQIEGFTPLVREALVTDGLIQRISNKALMMQKFYIFRPESERPPDFAQQDLQLHTALDYFCIKMEQKVQACHRDFKDRLKSRIEVQTRSLKRDTQDYKSTHLQSTLKFLAGKRKNLNTFSRQEPLKKLEELGMKFNIQERMKDKVLSSRQLISQGIRQQLLLQSRDPSHQILPRTFR